LKVTVADNRMIFTGPLLLEHVSQTYKYAERVLPRFPGGSLVLDLSGVEEIDSAGVVLLDEICARARQRGLEPELEKIPESIRGTLQTFSSKNLIDREKRIKPSFLERLGEDTTALSANVLQLLYLLADSVFFALLSLFRRRGVRKGEFINQSILIGMNAFPIVALISFLVGFILALQSAAQLRQFGASIFVADLIAISMTREMGPLMTAIIFAGRSGSAIASEIATMVVTEEADALRSMALNPVRYIVVPKIYAMTLTLPLLTVLSMLIGILGAMVIGVTYLDIGIKPFYNEVVNALVLKDIVTGLVKSLVFALIISIVGAFYGFRVRGGAEGVGRATTASVVASIFFVILADSILGLIFYFGKGVEI